MEQRTCAACGASFTPTHPKQRACPPTAEDRARAKGQPRSRCARKLYNATQRGKTVQVDCGHCGKTFDRPRGVSPAMHAGGHVKRYCSLDCQYAARSAEYATRFDIVPPNGRLTDDDRAERARDAAIAAFMAEPARVGVAAYRRSLRRDPCAYCGERPCSGIDHIEPTGKDGDRSDWTNMTGCCKRCNETKRTLPLLLALPWIPVSREYHDQRRLLFAA